MVWVTYRVQNEDFINMLHLIILKGFEEFWPFIIIIFKNVVTMKPKIINALFVEACGDI